MLAVAMVLIGGLLAVLPFMLDGDIENRQQWAQADVTAQLLAVQYQAALRHCEGNTPPADCHDGSDIDTTDVLNPSILDGQLAGLRLVVMRYDDSFVPGPGRLIAFVDQDRLGAGAAQALWGQVSAVAMVNSGGAAGVGFWRPVAPHAATGAVVSHAGESAYTLARQQGKHVLQDGNAIMVQPLP